MTAFTFNMTGGRVAVNDSRAGSEGGRGLGILGFSGLGFSGKKV